jgi:hypothetical protein
VGARDRKPCTALQKIILKTTRAAATTGAELKTREYLLFFKKSARALSFIKKEST